MGDEVNKSNNMRMQQNEITGGRNIGKTRSLRLGVTPLPECS